MTRAKFKCNSIKKYLSTVWNGGKPEQGVLYAFEFQAVTGNSEENESFFASTPTGNISISAIRDDLFEPGREYYVDFTPAEVI